MRKLMFALLGATSLAGVPGAVEAADIPAGPPPPLAPAFVPEPASVWTGLYVGAHVGYTRADSDTSDDFFDFDLDGDGLTDGYDGYLAGGQFGYNYQLGSVVLGLEADVSVSDLERENTLNYSLPNGSSESATFKAQSDWLATVRGRAGYAFDRFMVYAAGGVAFSNLEVSYRDTFTVGGAAAAGKDSKTVTGWTVGAGIEGMITPNLTARLEYLYVNFEDGKFNFTRNGATFSSDQSFDAHIIRGGLNYKLDW